MAVHYAQPAFSPDTPQINALKQQFKVAASSPPPLVSSSASTLRVPGSTLPVRAVAWDLFGLNARQLREIKALGFDATVMNCLWEKVQPTPDRWDWSRFARYADDAQNAGLQLIFRGPMAAPFWMDESFAFRNARGEASFHNVYGRVPSFWNRDAQSRMDEFLHRAYEALDLSSFWALEASVGQGGECRYQSVKFDSDGKPATEVPLWCFDEWALQSFRLSMQVRYDDDLNALNRVAGQKWRNWNEVMPAANMEQAKYFGDTLHWYQAELLRHIDSMVHRLQPHRRIVLSHAASLNYAPRFWGSGAVELEAQLWELSAQWRKYFVEIIHFYYSLLTMQPELHYYFSQQMARGQPARAYAGVEYATGATANAPTVQRMGACGMICGVNDHLYQFNGGVPTTLIADHARQLGEAIMKYKETCEPYAQPAPSRDTLTPMESEREHARELQEEYDRQTSGPLSLQDIMGDQGTADGNGDE